MSTTLTNSASQVSLASYGTGNPFYVDNGTSIVSTGTGQTAIYGDASQSWTLNNAGSVGGGVGGSVTGDGGASGYGGGSGYAGGFGIDVTGTLTLTNSGRIAGGEGGGGGAGTYFGGGGGGGVSISGAGTVTNMAGASIVGGAGNYGHLEGGDGGSGVLIGVFGTVANQAGAVIEGGAGGFIRYPFDGGYGGAGILLTSGGSITNAGTITGGAPGYRAYGVYPGGAGVEILGSADSTLINSGTISGGSEYAKAVRFDSGNDRLILHSGSVLLGAVDGGAGSNVLELAGDGLPGTVAGLGSTIIDFQTIIVDFGGLWTAADNTTLIAGSTLDVEGTLKLTGATQLAGGVSGAGTLGLDGATTIAAGASLSVASLGIRGNVTLDRTLTYAGTWRIAASGMVSVASGKTLTLTNDGELDGSVTGAGKLVLRGGVTTIARVTTTGVAGLTLSNSAVLKVDKTLTYTGKLTEGAGTRISIGAATTLTLAGEVGGSGAIDIGVGATLGADSAVAATESVAFAAKTGTLRLSSPERFRAQITHFVAGDKIDIANANFAFSKNETLTFVENAKKTEGTLTLKNGVNTVALHLFGQHIAQGFHIASDGHGGTMISYKPPAAHALDHLASGGG